MSATIQDAERIREACPVELRERPIWLCFRLEPKEDKPGKFDKVPYYAKTGRKRSGTQGSPSDRAAGDDGGRLGGDGAAWVRRRRHCVPG